MENGKKKIKGNKKRVEDMGIEIEEKYRKEQRD